MIDLLLRDFQDVPNAFDLYGAVERDRLIRWWNLMPWWVPDDLLVVWERTGGGELFDEDFVLLGPFPQSTLQDGVQDYNVLYFEKGMDKNMFLFHRSQRCCSVIHQKTKEILFFDNESFLRPKAFNSLLAWYIGTARNQELDYSRFRPIPEFILKMLRGGQ